MTDALIALFDDVANHWGRYLTALVALSGLTMSLIQIAKGLSLRKAFHRRRVRAWLYRRGPLPRFGVLPKGLAELEKALLAVTADGNANALYDAELEELCVHLAAATQTLVDYPHQSPDLLRAIAAAASDEDLDLVIGENRDRRGTKESADERQRVFDARNRVRALTHRSVEMFKLSTSADWRKYMQIASFALSTAIALVALMMSSNGFRDRPGAVLGTAVLAGFLAPVARDLLVALQQFRR
jgi:hypothetical protein